MSRREAEAVRGRCGVGVALCVAAIIGVGFFASHAAAGPVTKVIHVSVDGLRGDLLEALVDGQPGTYPNFLRLQNGGAYTYNARSDYNYTETIPNHISMLTGRPVSQPAGQPATVHHGYSNNFPGSNDTIHMGNPNFPYAASMFDVVHDHGGSTALFVSKTRLEILERSYNATNGAVDTIGADNGRDKIDTSLVTSTTSALMTSLISNLTATPRDYTFIHLTDPDTAVHSSGAGSSAWNAAVATTDGQLGTIFNLIDTHAAFMNQTAFIVTADHGGQASRSHTDASNPDNYTIPFFLWAPGIDGGTNIYSLLSNRFDPGTGRPDYNSATPPLRNGDSSNLGLSLLGLPPIPGSTLVPTLIPEVGTLGAMLVGVCLGMRRSGRRRA